MICWISLPYSSQSYRIAHGFPHVIPEAGDAQVGLKLLFLRKICLYVACAPTKCQQGAVQDSVCDVLIETFTDKQNSYLA